LLHDWGGQFWTLFHPVSWSLLHAVLQSNPQIARDQMTVTCTQGMIQELRICLTKDLEPRRCGSDTIKDCTLKDAGLEAVR
jgi:ribonuclease T2